MGVVKRLPDSDKVLSVVYTESGRPVAWCEVTVNMLLRRSRDLEDD